MQAGTPEHRLLPPDGARSARRPGQGPRVTAGLDIPVDKIHGKLFRKEISFRKVSKEDNIKKKKEEEERRRREKVYRKFQITFLPREISLEKKCDDATLSDASR